MEAQAKNLVQHHHKQLNIAIIGAGATGVELAAELHHAANQFSKYGLNSIDPKDVKISLIEAAPRVLPALPKRVSHDAEATLREIGVQVIKIVGWSRLMHIRSTAKMKSRFLPP